MKSLFSAIGVILVVIIGLALVGLIFEHVVDQFYISV